MPQSISTNTKTKKFSINLISETPFTVQGHGVHTAFLENIEGLKKIGIPVKTNSKEKCDIVHIHTIGPYSLFKLFKNRHQKIIITAHVVPASFVGSIILSWLWMPLAKFYLRFFYNRANAVIAVSPQVKKELEELGVKKKIYFIPNGVNLEKFQRNEAERTKIRKKYNIGSDDFVAIGSGQIQPRKGIEDFVNTAKELPDIKFLWVGGIPFKRLAADYKKMVEIQKTAPKNVIFTGAVSFDEMPSYYGAADIFFFPSFQENFPFAIVEAAATKLPLLFRDINEYKDTFSPNYIASDGKSFKSYILKLKDNDRFYDEYSAKSYEVALKYEEIKLIHKVVEVYQNVLGENKN